MDPIRLLDPKGYAKGTSKQRLPNYGPQQSRKKPSSDYTDRTPVNSSSSSHDPKALLNPKAAGTRQLQPQSFNMNDGFEFIGGDIPSTTMTTDRSGGSPGTGHLIERMHNVTNRGAVPPAKKRKAESLDDNQSDDDQKKANSVITSAYGGGIISDHMKAEREKNGAQGGPIDLTGEDDDDVVFVSETLHEDSKEVCLGKLFANASAFRIPFVPRSQAGALTKDYWPSCRVNVRRSPGTNSIIELFDRNTDGSGNAVNGTKFGNVAGKAAGVLCTLLDGSHVNKLRLKAYLEKRARKPNEVPGVRVSQYIPLCIVLYAPRNRAGKIGQILSQNQLFLSAPDIVDRGVEIANPHQPKSYAPHSTGTTGSGRTQSSQLSYGVQRSQEEMRREANDMFDRLVKSENLPEREANQELITTALMSHQKQALHFLVEHERGDQYPSQDGTDFSLWKSRINAKKQEVWYNIITEHEVAKKPELIRGGILADVMGLGKTLSILALIVDSLDEAKLFGAQEAPIHSEHIERNAKTTLIICPKSVMSNWETQIKSHTASGHLQIYSYHGVSRTQDVEELAKHHIVLASYNTVASEFSDRMRRRKALASIQWFRIVLDEAHQIRTHNTQVSQACCALLAQRRWAVTGTPVQNRLDDLGALIKFLRIRPFDEYSTWAKHIIAPFKIASENVIQHLRLLVDSITLRRMKDNIDLTERHEQIIRLTFSDDEMWMYQRFASSAQLQLRRMTKGGSDDKAQLRGKAYAHVLKSLSRLRQFCAHGREMMSEEDLMELEGLTAATAIELGDEPDDEPDSSFISEKHAYETFHMMSESEVDECINCGRKVGDKKVNVDGASDSPNDTEDDDESEAENESNTLAYLTPCYHLICCDCKSHYIAEARPKLTKDAYHMCAYCDQYIRFGLFDVQRSTLKSMLEARANKANRSKHAKWDETTYSGPSTKVKALLDDLGRSATETANLAENEPPIRSVVFSGWTSYLDLIEYALEAHNHGFVRLDGTMSIKARSAVLKRFATDPDITVLLVSIKAGGQGLNLTSANKVYMMEPQFNPGVEQQAIDRVHRLGQTRDVNITHYIMQDSVEEGILKLQEKKQKLAQLSMERKVSKSEEARKRIEELKDLFK